MIYEYGIKAEMTAMWGLYICMHYIQLYCIKTTGHTHTHEHMHKQS